MIHMIKFKGIAAATIGAALTLSLAAPAWALPPKMQEGEGVAAEAVTQVMGGWQTSEPPSFVTDEERQMFDATMAGYMGVQLEPVAVIATQLVAGTNYAYLVKATPISPDTQPYWCIIVLYQDLAGNVNFICKNDIDLANVLVRDAAAGPAVGSWRVSQDAGTGMLPQRAATAFSAATAGYTGMGFDPVVLLGTQVVSGTNYKFLCVGTTVTAEPTSGLYVVTVYEDLAGDAKITSVEGLDIDAYTSAPAKEALDEEAPVEEAPVEVVAESGKPSARRELANQEPETATQRSISLSEDLANRRRNA